MKFEDLVFKETGLFQIINEKHYQAKVFFSNGYGASVIYGYGSYGNDEAPYELAIIKGNDEDFAIVYDTPITDNVVTYQTAEQITELLEKIEALPEVSNG